MGVLYDYFRARDADAVLALMTATGGHALDPAAHPETGVLDLKGIEPTVTLGRLVGFVLGKQWRTDLVPTDLVWPPPDQIDQREYEGPWVFTVGERARDALAGVTDDQVPGLAARWAAIEEFAWHPPEPQLLASTLAELVALARAARAAGDNLYCWCCL
ncbi:hypothetical protein AAH979_18800 [Plantactinospora sp. ZYX-F-223]|uniref:hypothetical protein n=1 Tax=Plantactinospora sp. ZYX-F-223 TaxID=3144103 RepID=UPI0031FBD7BC